MLHTPTCTPTHLLPIANSNAGLPAAMEALAKMVAAAEAAAPGPQWAMPSVHLGAGVCKGKTGADVHRAFLLWSQKEADVAADTYNVSKALRRFVTFVDFAQGHYAAFFSTPVEFDDPKIQAASYFRI